MWILPFLACGDITNEPFAEDAEFLAALPSEERHTIAFEPPEDVPDAELPFLLSTTRTIRDGVNAPIFHVLTSVDTVRALRPSSRTGNGRVWGPYDWRAGVQVRVEMQRTGLGTFDWVFVAMNDGEEQSFLEGTHQAGETVATGDGAFAWDFDASSGLVGGDLLGDLVVDYDNQEGVDLVAQLRGISEGGAEPADSDYAYRLVDGEGDFQYLTTRDLPDDDSDEEGALSVRTRWIVGEGGRSDAVVTGGGLGGRTLEWTQCWDVGGALVHQSDNLAITEPVGEVAACVYAEGAVVDRL